MNQAAIALHEARLLGDQKRVAADLEERVALRTGELQATNNELERALKEINKLKDELRRENTALRDQLACARGGLAPWQVRRAKELIEAKLDGQLPLSRLAEECGLLSLAEVALACGFADQSRFHSGIRGHGEPQS